MRFFSKERKPIAPYDKLEVEKRCALYFLLDYLTIGVPPHEMSWALQYLEKAAKYLGITKKQTVDLKPFYNSYSNIIYQRNSK